jgi:small subunit ribosomal protein S6
MNRYEAMFIVKPELSESEQKALFNQVQDAVTKNNGKVANGSVWSEKRKLCFPINKHTEGVYYLMSLSLPPEAVKEIRHVYQLNENILRVLVSRLE